MSEKEIHGGMKLEIQVDDQYHPCISQHTDQVNHEKQDKEDQLDVFRFSQPHKDEVRHTCVIASAHSVHLLHTAEK